MSGIGRLGRKLVLAAAALALGATAALPAPRFEQRAVLAPTDGHTDDGFGYHSVAVSGDTVVVGAPWADDGANVDTGAAYVYVRAGGSWTLQARLTASVPQPFSRFGWSVAISGDTILAGAYFHDATETGAGVVYEYRRSGGTWTETSVLVSPHRERNGLFGFSVALEGDVAAIGAIQEHVDGYSSGLCHVFVRSGGVWEPRATLVPAEPATAGDFGTSVGLSGTTIVVGAKFSPGPAGTAQGHAEVFEGADDTWARTATLMASDATQGARFGHSIALDGDDLVVGAPEHVYGGVSRKGAAYAFSRTEGGWTETQILGVTETPGKTGFGDAIALKGGVLIGSSPVEGQVWVYRRDGASWMRTEVLTPADPTGTFGDAIALDGRTLFVASAYLRVGDERPGGALALELTSGQYILPAAVTWAPNAKTPAKSKFSATGLLNSSHVTTDWSGPAHVEIGGLALDLPGLVASRDRKSYSYAGQGLTLKLTPAPGGSSKASVTMAYTGDLSGKVPADGNLTIRVVSGEVDAAGVVTLAKGRYAASKSAIERNDRMFQLSALAATLDGAGKDALSFTASFPAEGTAPAAAPDVSVGLGSLAASIPGTTPGFRRSGQTWTFRGNAGGITSIVIDYVRGTITVKGSKLTLGTFANGAVPLTLSLAAGADAAQMDVIAVHAGKTLRY